MGEEEEKEVYKAVSRFQSEEEKEKKEKKDTETLGLSRRPPENSSD